MIRLKIGILCASDTELAPFLTHIKNDTVTEKAMLTFHSGFINETAVVALYCGVCKVNAAAAAQILIDSYGVGAMINAGTAGGMDTRVTILDTVIATEVAYHDVNPEILTDYHPWMPDEFFRADKTMLCAAKSAVIKCQNIHTIHFGRMVTGETFITDSGRDEINARLQPLSVDMETGSIAHVCYINNIPFIAVRAITDTVIHSGEVNLKANCKSASEISKDITLALLDELSKGSDRNADS